MIVLLIAAALFILIGLAFITGRVLWLVSGWDMMSDEEKRKYDGKPIGRNMGLMMIASGIAMILVDLGVINITIGSLAIIIIVLTGIIFMNRKITYVKR